MPVVWHGPAGGLAVELLPAGRCHIFHEDAGELSEADLRGLPVRWEVGGAPYCCARLGCGHTFHVSALAWHCLYRDMRCPMCRRGFDARMSAGSLPDAVRGAFARRLQDADAADRDEAALDDGPESEFSADSADDDEPGLLYAKYAAFERELRLVVEVRCGAREVFVYESPVHCMLRDEVALALEGASESLVPFRVQRSFARHLGSRVASCADQGALPISLRFSLTNPLFRRRLESAAVVSAAAEECDFELRRAPLVGAATAFGAAPAALAQRDAGSLVGLVRVRLGAGCVHMALDPRGLVALWTEGL
jgi:hypothetical protein